MSQPLERLKISSNTSSPWCSRRNPVPLSFGTRVHSTIDVKFLLSFVMPFYEYESLVNGFNSNTSQLTAASYLLSGFGANLNWNFCPAMGLKFVFINHCSMSPGLVRYSQTSCGDCLKCQVCFISFCVTSNFMVTQIYVTFGLPNKFFEKYYFKCCYWIKKEGNIVHKLGAFHTFCRAKQSR